jgi:hypothetical protein
VQDVVCHLACTFQQVADPGSIPVADDGDNERTAAMAVDARRDWSAAEVVDAYASWSEKALMALAPLQEPPAANVVIPLGNLGSHPLHLLAEAYVFDHYCHLRHDVLAPDGPITREPLPRDEAAVAGAVRWMLAGLPQMCADGLAALDRPLNLVLTDPNLTYVLRPGPLVVVEAGADPEAAATVTSDAHAFVQWGTKRRGWGPLVSIAGDAAYAGSILDVIHVI